MGLSNEERYTKFYNGMVHFRVRLVALHKHLEQHEINESAKVVEDWIKRLDGIVGRQIVRTDTNGAYWFTGPSDNTYKSRFDNHYGLNDQNEFWSHKGDENSKYYWKDACDLIWLTGALTKGAREHEKQDAMTLAYYWHAWDMTGFILYAMYRYQDDCFAPEVRKDFENLLGEMASRRWLLCNYMENWHKKEFTETAQLEQALLCKFKVYHDLLDAYGTTPDEKGYRRDNKDFNPFKTEIGWDIINGMVDKVANMSLHQVEKYLKEMQEKEWEQQRNVDDGPKEPKVNGIFGPKQRPRQVLEEIVETSTDLAEVKQAVEELETGYGTWIGGWEQRFEKAKAKKSKVRKKGILIPRKAKK